MNFRERLKCIPIINRIGKKYYIKKQFKEDYLDFIRYYIESAKRKKDFRYNILLIVHSIEKGMCMKNPRPFMKGCSYISEFDFTKFR